MGDPHPGGIYRPHPAHPNKVPLPGPGAGRGAVGLRLSQPLPHPAAYAWGAETTIYLRRDSLGQGVGKALYTALEAVAKAQHIRCLYACIGVPRGADPYLTDNSRQFHAHLGYRQVGEFQTCGYKFRPLVRHGLDGEMAGGGGERPPAGDSLPPAGPGGPGRLGIQL